MLPKQSDLFITCIVGRGERPNIHQVDSSYRPIVSGMWQQQAANRLSAADAYDKWAALSVPSSN